MKVKGSPSPTLDTGYKKRTPTPAVDQEARASRAEAQQVLKANPQGPHAAVVSELNSKSDQLRQLSMTQSVKTTSHEEHLKYVASQTNDLSEYAGKRYPGGLGADRAQRLQALGPRAQELLTDPVLMSPKHFDKFEAHAKQNPSVDPWQMRRSYEATLPANTFYRGLTVKDTAETNPKKIEAGKHLVDEATLREHGLVPQVNRTLDGNKDNIKRVSQGGSTLPALNEVHDKPIADVVEHRINAGKRFERFAPLRQQKQTPPPGGGETVAQRKARMAFNAQLDKEIAAGKERAKQEVLSQSVSDFATAEGVTTEKLFNPQTGKGKDRIFELKMPPLATMDPGEFLPASKVPAESMPGVPRKPEHEQITLTHIKPEQITGVHDPKVKK